MYKKEFVVLYDHGNGKTVVEFLVLHSKCFPALVTDFLELLYCPLRIRFGPGQSSMQAVQAVLARDKEGAARFLNFQSCFQWFKKILNDSVRRDSAERGRASRTLSYTKVF